MILQKFHVWIVLFLGLAAMAAALVGTVRTEPVPGPTSPGGFGTVEEAFAVASREVQRHISFMEDEKVVIDPDFRSIFLSKSKIWTIKGYASSPDNKKLYKWTMILNYDGVGEWEILVKTITPVSR